MSEHRIAITPQEFVASAIGLRHAEHRYEDPREPFATGDVVILEELTTQDPRRREFTGRLLGRRITYIDRAMGVRFHYALLHLGPEGEIWIS